MLFGIQEAFAIEAMLEPNLEPPSAVWGRMQVWCEGVSLGDFSEEYCPLYPSYLGFRSLEKSLPDLWEPEFNGLSDIELWNRLDDLLYDYHDLGELDDNRPVAQGQVPWERYNRYNFLTNWGEPFDRNGKSFIVCPPPATVRVLNRSLSPARGLSLEAPLGEVIKAIRAYLQWFESEAQRLSHQTGVNG